MTVKIIQFLAILITALSLIPSGAHLFALPNKIALSQAAYFTVQGIYRGWAVLGVLLLAGLAANIALAVIQRSQTTPLWLAAGSVACFLLMLAIFFLWTRPANLATADWTEAPTNWETLRQRWEYSHAANAAVVFAALCLTLLSALSWRPALS